MRSSILTLLLFAVMLIALDAQAQSERKQITEPPGSISGRVTLDGKPAPGVKVSAFKDSRHSQGELVTSAKTDQHGQFQLTGLPSDRYHIVVLAPAYVLPESTAGERPLSAVPLAEGETIEGLDFKLIRGGVITGRVTDEGGQPLTREVVEVFQLFPGGGKRPMVYFLRMNGYDFSTDDRGIYRIFGLPPGRYVVSAGQEIGQGGSRLGTSTYRPQTFYPGVTDESKAGVVEVAAGSEATGIDIAIGRPVRTYSASGRVIDASTGKPVPNAELGYGTTYESNGGSGSSFSRGLIADAKGNFRLDGLLPGNFHVMATPREETGLHSNVASFQIKDQDVKGLEIKIRRGSSVSGVLVIEGVNDPEVIAKFSRLKVWASAYSPDIPRGMHNTGRAGAVNPDGGFHIAGLHPGKIFFSLSHNPDSTGFFVSRVERGGVDYAEGIEVGPGEQVNGVRVILGYANGRIRGRVKIEGGKLPTNAIIDVRVWRMDGPNRQSFHGAEIDPNGFFLLEALATGQYEVSINVHSPTTPEAGHYVPLAETVTKTVSVTSGVETEVVLVVELTRKGKDQ